METFHSLMVPCWQFQAVNLILPDLIYNHHDPSRMSSRLHSLIKYTTLRKNIKIKIALNAVLLPKNKNKKNNKKTKKNMKAGCDIKCTMYSNY